MTHWGKQIKEFLEYYKETSLKTRVSLVKWKLGVYHASFACSTNGKLECFIRAPNRELAKIMLPGCEFYR